VEGDPAHVVAAELVAELLRPALPLRPDPDVVQVDLVLDGDEVHDADQVVERDEGAVQLRHRSVEGAVVGGVDAGEPEEPGEEHGDLLSPVAHLAGELAVLPGAGPPDGPAELGLRPGELIHGADPPPGAGRASRRSAA
jgi:hypothetical protein